MTAFWRGVRECAPISASALPFALVVALSATEAGLDALATMGMSVVVFAGAAQLTALELARGDAPAVIIIGAAIVVNLRFVLYSASLSAQLEGVSAPRRGLMAYALTDQAFALTARLAPREHRVAYYAGAALTLWVVWQIGMAAGIVVGASVPTELSLDFAVALVFIALVVPALNSRPALAAALSSVAVYLAGASLPYGLGLLPAAAVGVAVGGLSAPRATP